jgi:hypothetical protein
LARYGTPYAIVREPKKSAIGTIKYYLLSEAGSSSSIWTVVIGFDDKSRIVGLWLERRLRDMLHMTARNVSGKLELSGDGVRLYQDLAEVGLNLGMPSARPKLVTRGRVNESSRENIKYIFANGDINVDRQTGDLEHFAINDTGALSRNNLMDVFSGKAMMPIGRLVDAFRAGPSAVKRRYGLCQDSRVRNSQIESLSYCILADYGHGQQAITISFFFTYGFIIGDTDLRPLYIYTPPSAKSK